MSGPASTSWYVTSFVVLMVVIYLIDARKVVHPGSSVGQAVSWSEHEGDETTEETSTQLGLSAEDFDIVSLLPSDTDSRWSG